MRKPLAPIGDIGVKARNLNCFGQEPYGFDEIKPVNVAIGRNNSGKSTLLDLIEYVAKPFDISARGHLGQQATVLLEATVSDNLVARLPTSERVSLDDSRHMNVDLRNYAIGNFKGQRIRFQLQPNNSYGPYDSLVGHTPSTDREIAIFAAVGKACVSHSTNPFHSYRFRRIVADRNVVPEQEGKLEITPNGNGVTNAIRAYLNHEDLDSDLIERTFLSALNDILRPDTDFSRILVQTRADGAGWEVHLVEEKKGRSIPMSRTGSGLKTVMIVLANLIIIPQIEKAPLAEYLFAFEELENNLHPAAQRRLFRYLRNKAKEQHCHCFLTTHSNVVIDQFANDELAQILHVTHNGTSASVERFSSSHHGWRILDDLDIRASDLLQTNAVIWAEGPSDRIYFNRWIKLWTDGQLQEGIHYQCLPYGGAVAKHFGFDDPEFATDLINALRVNRHAVFIADRDRDNETDPLKETTERLRNETNTVGGIGFATKGREVENYIPVEAWQKLLANDSLRGPGQFSNAIEYANSHLGVKQSKVGLANKIVEHLTRDNLQTALDLGDRLDEIRDKIREWNRL